MQWDDVRVFLAVIRGGTVSAAAHTLGVSRSTVNRRLDALESWAGIVLFDRGPGGLAPTEAALQLRPIAYRMEEEALGAERLFAGAVATISGPIEVTLFEAIGEILAPAFAEFQSEHPDVDVRLCISNRALSLSRREADLALRGVENPTSDLFGVFLGQMDYAIYGRRDVVERENPPWILWDEALGATRTWSLARSLGKPLRVAAIVDCQYLMNELVCCGAGVAVLPVTLAAKRPELVPMGAAPAPGMGMNVWALTHPDLRRSIRLRAMMRFLAERAVDLMSSA